MSKDHKLKNSLRREEKAYDVGYGKPPKATQFKPGQSGNPKGRPNRPSTPIDGIRKRILKPVSVREGNTVRKMAPTEAIFANLLSAALRGHLPSIRLLIQVLDRLDLLEEFLKADMQEQMARFQTIVVEFVRPDGKRFDPSKPE